MSQQSVNSNSVRQQEAYNEFLDDYQALVTPLHRLYRQFTIERWLPNCVGKDVLDLGCGNAYVLTEILSESIQINSYTGVDISDQMILRNSAKYGSSRIRFLTDDAEQLRRIPDQSLDVVISYGCLHHLERPERSITAIANKLRKGGSLFALEVNRVHPARSFIGFWAHCIGLNGEVTKDFLNRTFRPGRLQPAYVENHPGHPGVRSPEEYYVMFQNAGLGMADVRGVTLELLPYRAYRNSPAVFKAMSVISRPLMRLRRLKDAPLLLHIHATK